MRDVVCAYVTDNVVYRHKRLFNGICISFCRRKTCKQRAYKTGSVRNRNRRKIVSVIENARHFLEVQREFGSFDRFLWAYVDGKPIVNSPETDADVPASTPLSDRISRDLKKRGFTFVGTTIVYSLLQSAGLVDDHLKGCGWHASCRPPE